MRAEEEMRECTFRPQIFTRGRRSVAVAPRYLENQSATDISVSKEKEADTSATFAPRTNPVTRAMPSVQSYLEENAFERLSRVKTVAALAASVSSVDQSVSTPASAAKPASAEKVDSRSLEEFLARQNAKEVRRCLFPS